VAAKNDIAPLAAAIVFLCMWTPPAGAQVHDSVETKSVETESVESESVEAETADSDPVDVNEELDEQLIDVEGSIDNAKARRGFSFDGDLRTSLLFSGSDIQDSLDQDSGFARVRWRLRSILGITEKLRAGIGVAGLCSTKECDPDAIFQPNVPTGSSIKDGQITIDSLFLHSFRLQKFDVAVGRLQTKFVARGGIFSKSLDRNDSNSMNVNWTDGLHGTLQTRHGWEPHLIVQYNSPDGAGNVRRDPLDFSDSRSRVSYFFAWENVEPKRRMIQRGLDITYMPSSLLVDGADNGVVDDYWGLVARAAARWPIRDEGWRFRVSTELGYAPNTQTKSSESIPGSGDVGGVAWNMTASIMDFLPGHSIGINYGRTEAGWLLSPAYVNNQKLAELRYVWRPIDHVTLDVRGRWRDQLEAKELEEPASDRFDFYARITWSFDIKKY
jgi:hypothetical protein